MVLITEKIERQHSVKKQKHKPTKTFTLCYLIMNYFVFQAH